MHDDHALTAPILHVVPLTSLRREATPIFTAATIERLREQLRRPIPSPAALDWHPGKRATCVDCGRDTALRRDGEPVHHKVPDRSRWCLPELPPD